MNVVEHDAYLDRVNAIIDEITLGMDCTLLLSRDAQATGGRLYLQIRCWRRDAITGEMGYGYGGKGWLSEHMTDSEIIQVAFGLYRAYWEHEARETFTWRERRVFGPHISTEALWSVARKVDVRSAMHREDQR